jgi:Tfp pilus assembly protein PilF
MDKNVVEAYIGLANIEQQRDNQKEYYMYLEKAFNIDNSNPNLLLILAEHYLYKRDYEKAKKLA